MVGLGVMYASYVADGPPPEYVLGKRGNSSTPSRHMDLEILVSKFSMFYFAVDGHLCSSISFLLLH